MTTVRILVVCGCAGRRSRAVRIEVDDALGDDVVVGRSRGLQGGPGMLLVERCNAGWEVVRHKNGKTVSAEITCSTRTPGREV